jgi:hypothetical protein
MRYLHEMLRARVVLLHTRTGALFVVHTCHGLFKVQSPPWPLLVPISLLHFQARRAVRELILTPKAAQ